MAEEVSCCSLLILHIIVSNYRYVNKGKAKQCSEVDQTGCNRQREEQRRQTKCSHDQYIIGRNVEFRVDISKTFLWQQTISSHTIQNSGSRCNSIDRSCDTAYYISCDKEITHPGISYVCDYFYSTTIQVFNFIPCCRPCCL